MVSPEAQCAGVLPMGSCSCECDKVMRGRVSVGHWTAVLMGVQRPGLVMMWRERSAVSGLPLIEAESAGGAPGLESLVMLPIMVWV